MENQESVVISIMLPNPSSNNIVLRIFSNEGSATGELKIHTMYSYMYTPTMVMY